jgi:hypothetical protein
MPKWNVGSPRQLLKLLLCFALLIAGVVIAARYEIDFPTLWRTAVLVFEGKLDQVYAPFTGRYFYPPFSLILIEPLGALGFPLAKWIWIALQSVAFVGFWKYLGRLYPFLNSEANFWSWVLIFIVSINPLHNNFQSNNIQTMLAAGLLGCEYLSRGKSKGQFWAGFICALIGAIKIFPLFIAGYYFVSRPRPTKVGVASGMVASLLLPFLFFGKTGGVLLFTAFSKNLTTYNQDNSPIGTPDILCLPSLIARLAGGASYTGLLIKISVLLIAAVFYAWAYAVSRRTQTTPKDENLHFWALALALSAFLNPSTRPHYFQFFVPAYCSVLQLIKEKANRKGWLQVSVALSVLLVAFTAEGVVGHDLNDRLEFLSLPTYGMLILCGVLAVSLFRGNRRLQTI